MGRIHEMGQLERRIKVFSADDTESLEREVNAWLLDNGSELTIVEMLFATSRVDDELTAFSVLVHHWAVPA